MQNGGYIIHQRNQDSLCVFETISEEDCYNNEIGAHTKRYYGVRLDKGEYTQVEVYFVPQQMERNWLGTNWFGSFVIKFGSNITAFERGKIQITQSKNKWNIEHRYFFSDPTRHSYMLTMQNGYKYSFARCNLLLERPEETWGFYFSNEGKLKKEWYYNDYDVIRANIYVTENTLVDRDVKAIALLTPQVIKSMSILVSLLNNENTETEHSDIFLQLYELPHKLDLQCRLLVTTEEEGKNVSVGIDFIDKNKTTTCSVYSMCDIAVEKGRIQLLPRYATKISVYSDVTDIEKSLKENGFKNLLKLKYKLDAFISEDIQNKKTENLEL